MNEAPQVNPKNVESQKDKRNLSISILAFSVLIMIIAGILITKDMNSIKAFISRAGAWGILISIMIYAILGFTLIPSEPLTLFIGVLFGPLLATLIAGIGNILSGFVEYYLGTHIGSATNFEEKKDSLPFGLGKLKVESPLFLIGARMIPGWSPKIVSMLAGIYHVPLLRFLWTTVILAFLGSSIFAFGGFGVWLLIKSKLP